MKLPIIINEAGKIYIEAVPQLGWGKGKECTFIGALEAALASGRTRTVGVGRDVTVLLHYSTAGLDESGRLQLRNDIYDYDRAILDALAAYGLPVCSERVVARGADEQAEEAKGNDLRRQLAEAESQQQKDRIYNAIELYATRLLLVLSLLAGM
jgi:hypothetical protein